MRQDRKRGDYSSPKGVCNVVIYGGSWSKLLIFVIIGIFRTCQRMEMYDYLQNLWHEFPDIWTLLKIAICPDITDIVVIYGTFYSIPQDVFELMKYYTVGFHIGTNVWMLWLSSRLLPLIPVQYTNIRNVPCLSLRWWPESQFCHLAPDPIVPFLPPNTSIFHLFFWWSPFAL